MSSNGEESSRGRTILGHVLVCDDSEDVCALARLLLEKESYRVETVHRGEDALDRLNKGKFDLMLLDLVMPGISGIDVIRHVRSDIPRGKYFPIVLVTGNTDTQSRLAGLEAGATDFLTKPFNPPELLARLRNHLHSKQLHDRLLSVNQSLEAERDKVLKVQRSLLPDHCPAIDGLKFAWGYQPSGKAGGDFFDVIRRSNGNVLLAVGDVSGHGIPSAMYMSILRAVLHSEEAAGNSVPQILHTLNRVLYYGLDDYSFVTFYIAEYDPATKRIEQAGAGHLPAILHNVITNEVREVPLVPAFPLGIELDFECNVSTWQLQEGDRFFAYTDGLIEQPGCTEGEPFGKERLFQELQSMPRLDLHYIPQRLLAALQSFSGETLPRDDVTMLLMEVDG